MMAESKGQILYELRRCHSKDDVRDDVTGFQRERRDGSHDNRDAQCGRATTHR